MTDSPSTSAGGLSDQPRRGFITSAMATVIGGLVGLVARDYRHVVSFLIPSSAARKKKEGGDEGFINLKIHAGSAQRSHRTNSGIGDFLPRWISGKSLPEAADWFRLLADGG